MKLHYGFLASSVLAISLLGGCATNPHSGAAAAPDLRVRTSAHNIESGTSARVTALTSNLVGTGNIRWSVSPNVGHIQVDSAHGQTAIFSADQAGTYIVKAAADTGNGEWVSDSVDITVHGVTDSNGRPVSSEK